LPHVLAGLIESSSTSSRAAIVLLTQSKALHVLEAVIASFAWTDYAATNLATDVCTFITAARAKTALHEQFITQHCAGVHEKDI
jgi:hypothetical protein